VSVQVVDDILDVTQTTEVLGKTAAKDLAVNKTTYPKLLGLEKSREVRIALPTCLHCENGWLCVSPDCLVSLAALVRRGGEYRDVGLAVWSVNTCSLVASMPDRFHGSRRL
jgi:hypothetical protein